MGDNFIYKVVLASRSAITPIDCDSEDGAIAKYNTVNIAFWGSKLILMQDIRTKYMYMYNVTTKEWRHVEKDLVLYGHTINPF